MAVAYAETRTRMTQEENGYALSGAIDFAGNHVKRMSITGKGRDELSALDNYREAINHALEILERLGAESNALPVGITLIG
ncbi:MAG: hypothetical protein HY513_01810 [Candidatus Aenigmarchaeota archaeon]|nr:hypothetical protein [Candidatus Aenigmarchaeota archaeon]